MSSQGDLKVEVLDHGYVHLVDWMPHCNRLESYSLSHYEFDGQKHLTSMADRAITDAARVSYADGTNRKRADYGLLKYLYEHKHMTPFEMVEFKFEVKCPLFIARQWMRHRGASYNEVSARYSQVSDCWYTPAEWRLQANKNKQGSEGASQDWQLLTGQYDNACAFAYATYLGMLERGIAREQARMILPQSMYTTFIYKTDLRSLLNFLELRSDNHAQYEIREYANTICSLVERIVPATIELMKNNRPEPLTNG
jgi:thymidylate synthase (FAD)